MEGTLVVPCRTPADCGVSASDEGRGPTALPVTRFLEREGLTGRGNCDRDTDRGSERGKHRERRLR